MLTKKTKTYELENWHVNDCFHQRVIQEYDYKVN